MAEPVAVGKYPGIRVEFHEKPYRHYLVNGDKAVSVTTAIGVLHKPLDGYVERTTLRGVWCALRLAAKGKYEIPTDRKPGTCPWHDRNYVPYHARKCSNPSSDCTSGDPALCRFSVDLKDRGWDARAKTNRAAERGVDVHQVWQDWNERQVIPNINDYPKDRHGYIRSMSAAIVALRPQAVETESVVGSAVHGFAGRLDTVVVIDTEDGLTMIDLKTASGIWRNSMFPQLAGYELARRECGLRPTVRQGILRLDASGKFDIKRDLAWSDAEPDDFLAILAAWKSQQRWARR